MQFTTMTGRCSLLILSLFFLWGCQSTPPVISNTPAVVEYLTPQVDANALLERAQTSNSPQKEQLLFEAAQHIYNRNEKSWARNILASINSAALSPSNFIQYSLLFSDIALTDDAYFLAQRILTDERLDKVWQGISIADQVTLRQRRADLFLILGEPHASVSERLALQPLINIYGQTPELDLSNQDALWHSLMSMPTSELHKGLEQSANFELKGWYELALISKDNQSNLELQQAQINNWVRYRPEHPASLRLPSDLQFLQRLISERPTRIALLLPQQGNFKKASDAIRDGFMAAHYQAIAQKTKVPEIAFYDTSAGDIETIYNSAVADGSQLIIGPLKKSNVSKLAALDEIKVPTLAVNYSDTKTLEPTENLYQFGLSTEDEGRQVAQRAWVEGHRQAMILYTDTSWGKRSADAFQTVWLELGGTIVTSQAFSEQQNYSNTIKSALNISDSELRSKNIKNLLNQQMEFEPRRRQDIDMIFLVAKHNEARQIKPTLDFHYASRIPIYASSHIYTGEDDSKKDRDMNGIRFTTLPWFFEKDNTIKTTIAKSVKPAPSYQRLYALGVDTYHLYPRLKQMQKIPATKLYGVTGSLSLNNNYIEREQVWAKIQQGIATPLPMTVSK
jgi:outer membrane PBP1 activator LpoA protein